MFTPNVVIPETAAIRLLKMRWASGSNLTFPPELRIHLHGRMKPIQLSGDDALEGWHKFANKRSISPEQFLPKSLKLISDHAYLGSPEKIWLDLTDLLVAQVKKDTSNPTLVLTFKGVGVANPDVITLSFNSDEETDPTLQLQYARDVLASIGSILHPSAS